MRWPAEWEPQEAVWVGFPGDPVEWPVALADAQREAAALAGFLASGDGAARITLVCRTAGDARIAAGLADAPISILTEPFGDIWLRDTGPLVLKDDNRRDAQLFRFNGWGGKFDMAGDQDIGRRLAEMENLETSPQDWILEGGAIDGDGGDWLVTTEQCLLNPNRNPVLDQQVIENKLKNVFSISNILWLGDGLQGDHTDGHVDNLARFVGPETLVVPAAQSGDDPNAAVYDDAANRAQKAGLTVHRIPSAGRHEIDGAIAPASHVNFVISNGKVAVPQFGIDSDEPVVAALQQIFGPEYRVEGLSSRALLRGGGSFHCMTQHLPAV